MTGVMRSVSMLMSAAARVSFSLLFLIIGLGWVLLHAGIPG